MTATNLGVIDVPNDKDLVKNEWQHDGKTLKERS